MKHSRYIALALALIVSLPVMTACSDSGTGGGEGTETQKKNTPDAVEDPYKNLTFTDADYSGENFVFLTYDEYQTDFIDNYIWNEEDGGDPVKKATIDRNRAVKEKYGIEIKKDMTSSPQTVSKQRMQSGTCDFDVVYEWGVRLVPNALDGLYYDLLSVPNIRLENSYWTPSAQESLTVANKMMIFTNDISMNNIAWAGFKAFNKQIAEDYKENLRSAGYSESPYDYVRNNEWTYDTYLGMGMAVYNDVNGNNECDKEDIYGFFNMDVGEILQNSGFQTIKLDNDGFKLMHMEQRVRDVYDKYKSMLTNTSAMSPDIDWAEGEDISSFPSIHKARRFLSFGEGHIMLDGMTMDMTHEFVEMKDEYGVLPNPKYTREQENYCHYVDTTAPMFALPIQTEDFDRTGIILEYMAYQSEKYLLPAFYETTIQYKRMNCADDLEMLDIIRGSIQYKWTSLYYLGFESGNCTADSMLNEMLASGKWGSVFNRYKDHALSELEDLYERIDAIEFDE